MGSILSRKRLKLFVYVFLGMCAFTACSEDERNTESLVDPWTRERTPVNFRLESQIGNAVITNDWRDDGVGTIHVSLVTGGLDMSKVKVDAVDFKFPQSEFCPESSVNAGDYIDLSSGSAKITVTAYNGETRVYTVDYEQFTDPLEGTYIHAPIPGILDASAPQSSMVIIGGWTDAIVMSTDMDKSWHWGEGYTHNDEMDNTLSFMLTDVDPETGLTRGTTVNLAGDNGAYANYVYNNTNDVNAFYRIFPAGASRWAKDSDGNIHVYAIDDTDYANELYVVKFLPAGTYTFSTKDITIGDCAFMREHVTEEVIDWNWPDTRWMVDNIHNTFWMMHKSSDNPVEGHGELAK